MKRNARRDNRGSRPRVGGSDRRGNASAEGMTVTAVLAAALVLGTLVLRDQRRDTSVIQLDRAALNSSTIQWIAAAVICLFAVGCAVAVLRRFLVVDDDLLDDVALDTGHARDAHTSGETALALLSDSRSELGRMFGPAPVATMHEVTPIQPPAPAPQPTSNERLYRALVHNSADTIFIANGDATIQFASDSVHPNFGHRGIELLGHHLLEYVHAADKRAVRRAWKMQDANRPGSRFTIRCRVRGTGDSWHNVELAGINLVHDAAIGGIVLTARDITARAEAEEQLTHRAFHDPLTALANRALFRDRVEHALARARREKVQGVVVLFLDLDDFKSVNDSMGHDAGDQLLVAVAAKLLNATRGSDTVARLGGDEFAILLENTRVDDEVLVVARRLISSLSAPMLVGARELRKPARVGTSIGVARANPGDTADTLLRNADLAMYKAKKAGKGRIEIFHPDMQLEVAERMRMEGDMRNSLVAGTAFHLLYQPIVNLATRSIIGVESFVRWDHPQRGTLAPGAFLPLAEESGLIVPLGRWILREACRQASRWHAAGAPSPFGMTINLSARQLRDASLPRDVEEALTDFGVDPASVTFDITESVIMSDIDSTLGTLFELKELGVCLAIDDFGTGYSSLSYLRQFPVDVLKIDKSFVDGVTKGGQHSALARTVIALAETLGLRTVAEGIEHPSQHDVLVGLGCECGQGFLFAKPLPADQIVGIVDKGSAMIQPGTRELATV